MPVLRTVSDAPVQTQAGLEAQPPLPVRRLHNFIYCPRLFYFQWVENIFQESLFHPFYRAFIAKFQSAGDGVIGIGLGVEVVKVDIPEQRV